MLERTSWIVVPVVPQLLFALAVRPNQIVTVVPIERWCVPNLLLGNLSTIALKRLLIREFVPRDGAVVNPNAEKAAKRHVNIEDPALTFSMSNRLMVPIRLPC